jgi:hypothetical protein
VGGDVSREAYSPPDPTGWLAGHLKLILFPLEPQQRERRQWWFEIANKEPDEQSRKKEEVEEAGLLSPGVRLTVSVNPIRLEINIEAVSPPTPDGVPSEDMPTLGPLVGSENPLARHVFPWLASAPPVKRIGLAMVLAFPTGGHDENYKLLDRMLETVYVGEESSDIHFRINRKTVSHVIPGMPLNRLMGWTSQKLARQMMTLSGDRLEIGEAVGERFYTLLALDINTDAQRTEPIPAGVIESLCREMLGLAEQIVANGDKR